MPSGPDQHVEPHKKGWAVRADGSSRATETFDTKKEAVKRAREIASNYDSSVIKHRKDGSIQGQKRKKKRKPRTKADKERSAQKRRERAKQKLEEATPEHQHVIPYSEGWGVRPASSTEPSHVYASKLMAVEKARVLAMKTGADVVVHDFAGAERKRWTPVDTSGTLREAFTGFR